MTTITVLTKPAIRIPAAGARALPYPALARRSVACRYRVGDYSEADAGPRDYDTEEHKSLVQTGIVFSPAAEIGNVLHPVETAVAKVGPSGVPRVSIGRMDFAAKAEVAINEQIAIELNNSYLYLSAAAYFSRDNVGLPGFAAHFQYNSNDEREHAIRLMEFQTRRGGRVVLASLLPPPTEFDHEEKGDALHAAQIALSLEKLNFAKLRALHSLADEADDSSMTHFIEDYLLDEQSQDVKEAAVLVSQLQRAGKGLGVFTIDYALQRKYNVEGAVTRGLANVDADGNGTHGTQLAITPLL